MQFYKDKHKMNQMKEGLQENTKLEAHRKCTASKKNPNMHN